MSLTEIPGASQLLALAENSNEGQLRHLILDLVGEYARRHHAPRPFIPGESPVPVSGKVYGAPDMQSLVDSALDFWLTTGRYNTQATVAGRVDDQLIVTANAALGSRPSAFTRQWLTAPNVRPAAVSNPIERGFPAGDGLHTQLDTRAAQLTNGDYHVATEDGRVLLWVKPHFPCALDAVLLAVVADYLPMGVGRALGTNMGGNSLDNTIRIHQIVPTEWLLCDLQIAGVHDGFGHGAMSLFAETGELLATAGQSLILRSFPPQPEGQSA